MIILGKWNSKNTVIDNFTVILDAGCIQLISIIVITVIILCSVCGINTFLKKLNLSKDNPKATIIKATKANKLSSEFLLAYILPMIAFDFSDIQNIALFLVYFVVLAYLRIRNNNIYTNILLEFKGYRIYTCDLECMVIETKHTYHDSLIISKDDLTQEEGNDVSYWDFYNYVYIAIDGGQKVMSKEILKNMCSLLKEHSYSWTLYFFKVDNRGKQPYKMSKVRFKNGSYLSQYATNLLNATENFQIEPISSVQNYDGENTKVSCDKLLLTDALISEQWTSFNAAVVASSDKKIEGRINGYILYGQPSNTADHPVTFVKVANPITKLANKKSVVFSTTVDDELDLITDDVCRLYLTVDFIVYSGTIYTFNHTFETLFNLEKTMAKVKQDAITEIVSTNAFADVEAFKSLAAQYKSSRTFITLKSERVSRIKDKRNRKKVADMLHIPLDDTGNFAISTADEASLLIRYLCFKIFQDNETKDVLEANSVTKLSIA